MDSQYCGKCPNCNEKYTEAYLFPCTHSFCSKCTNLMKNEAETTCLLCSKSCHQDDVKRNTFLEKICSIKDEQERNKNNVIICEVCGPDDNTITADKYCVDCNQHMCDKCSTMHIRLKSCCKHVIVDKKDKEKSTNKDPELYCEKHKQNLNMYCETCDIIICPSCSMINSLHINHKKSDNLEEVFAKSNSDINNKINEMNNNIKNRDKLVEENKQLEINCLQNFDKVRNEIESYSKELKDHIDKLTNSIVDKIITIKTDFIKSIQENLKEINEYFSSLTNVKIYFEEVVKNGSHVDVFNLRHEMNKSSSIKNKPVRVINKTELTFQKPSLDKIISTEFVKSFTFGAKKDLEILSLKNNTNSTCIFNDKLYTIYHKDNIINIDIYNKRTMIYNTSIDFKPNVTNKISYSYTVNTLNNLFLYYQFESDKHTYIFKLKSDNKTFVEWKTLEEGCHITSTYQHTLLARTKRQLIELSENGDELKRFTISETAILRMFIDDHQLIDGRYVVTSFKLKSVILSLLDTKRTFIKSFTQESTAIIRTCTDGKKYIFILECDVGKITVLSTDLQYLFEFSYPGVRDIYYDKINDKVILIKNREIIYFTYYLGKLF